MSEELEHFDGPEITAEDCARLGKQKDEIQQLMADCEWRTLAEIEKLTGFPQASVSAQLRHLRKKRFGSFVVERQRRTPGTWEYRVLEPIDRGWNLPDLPEPKAKAEERIAQLVAQRADALLKLGVMTAEHAERTKERDMAMDLCMKWKAAHESVRLEKGFKPFHENALIWAQMEDLRSNLKNAEAERDRLAAALGVLSGRTA